MITRFIADLIAEIRRLSPRQVVAAEAGLLLSLAGFPLGNSIGIVLLPLGLLLIIASLFLARSRMDALRGLALILLTLAAIIVVVAVLGLVATILGSGDDGRTGEVTPTR